MLSVNQQEMNLGKLKYGVPFSFKYILKNNTDKPISIHKVVLGCNSCTTASIEKPYIPAGETSDLNVVFTPGSTGSALKGLSVMYHGGAKELKLKFRAIVDE